MRVKSVYVRMYMCVCGDKKVLICVCGLSMYVCVNVLCVRPGNREWVSKRHCKARGMGQCRRSVCVKCTRICACRHVCVWGR